MQNPEFKVGDNVTFQPYEIAFPATVAEINPNRYKDGRCFYLVKGYKNGYQTVNSWTSGECLLESKYFKEYVEK